MDVAVGQFGSGADKKANHKSACAHLFSNIQAIHARLCCWSKAFPARLDDQDRNGDDGHRLAEPRILRLDSPVFPLVPAMRSLPPSAWEEPVYSEWGAVFGDEVAAAAIIERLLHYSTTVNVRGESYRLKDKKRAGMFTMPTTASAHHRGSGGEFETGAQTKSVLRWGISHWRELGSFRPALTQSCCSRASGVWHGELSLLQAGCRQLTPTGKLRAWGQKWKESQPT